MKKVIRRLFLFVKPYWLPALLAPLLMIVEVTMDLIQPTLMQQMVDIGVKNKDLTFVVQTALKMIGFAVIGFIGGYGCSILSNIASLNVGKDLRQALFSKVQSLSFGNIDKLETGSIITRLTNDVVQIQSSLGMLLRVMVRAPMMLIGSLVMAFITAPSLSWVLLAITPILFFAISRLIKLAFPIFSKVQQKIDQVNIILQENLAGMRAVKAFVRSEHEVQRFEAANSDLMSITMRGSRLTALLMPVMLLCINLGIVAVLWLGGLQVLGGSLMVGRIIAFINYLSRLLFSLMMINMVLVRISRAGASAERVVELLDTEQEIKNKPDAINNPQLSGEVRFDKVYFSYRNSSGDPVLKDISFTADPGETIAIMGATGSGKSTLVQLIPRLYDVDSGSITIDGIDVRDFDKQALRRKIGMALQTTVLFSGSIMDNIRYGAADATEEEVVAAARAAQAHSFISSLPRGYQTRVEQRGVNLSGGQKQRIAIARSLLVKPAILIFDDSTSAVDVTTERHIQNSLKSLMANCTSFIIAQRISTVLEADKIIVLEDGEINDIGNHQQLIQRNKIYQEIYNSQLGEGALPDVS